MLVFMVWIGGKAQFLVVAGIVITKDNFVGGIHILVNIHQTIFCNFDVNKFAQIQGGTINEAYPAPDEAFMCPPFLISNV